ncbi:MAG TPA: hypothetical protein VMS88_09300, partial [Terriglobales bacterium]|nr:hypothetical protein [Terriglobales bacterium]
MLAAAFWLQRAALRAPFFADDFLFLDQVRNHSLGAALASPDPIGNFVRPVGRQLDFWLLSRLGGESPLPFHVVNLALFLVALALLFVIARRLAGAAAAAIAAGFVALHYAADVPLLWASGSQDLLALTCALAALALFLGGRRWPAAVALLAGMLSKETVLFTPVVAALAARRRGEPWRATLARAGPLALAPALWAVLWLALAIARPGVRQAVGWSAAGLAAAFVHLAQVALGIEWRAGGELRFLNSLPGLIPTLLVLAAVAIATWNAPAVREDRSRAIPPAMLGLAWAALGALPIAAVSSVWSAYYYLFALCGLGLAIGAWLARSPAAAFALVVLLAWGSENGRRLDEFITVPGIWTRQSHVNRLYVERATSQVGRYLAQLRRALPALPHRSTLFFGGVPSFIGFQSADGPLVRWAYRDSSLRSYYLLQFSAERYRRGPAFAFTVHNDSLEQQPLSGPFLRACALGAMLAERPRVALEILDLPALRGSVGTTQPYWRAWMQWALGDTAAARASLIASGAVPAEGPMPEATEAIRMFTAGDTTGAINLLSEGV